MLSIMDIAIILCSTWYKYLIIMSVVVLGPVDMWIVDSRPGFATNCGGRYISATTCCAPLRREAVEKEVGIFGFVFCKVNPGIRRHG